jgi:hypothetical protein
MRVIQATGERVRSTQQQARVAGIWYLLLALSAPLGLVYVPGKVIVSGNAMATADNLRAFESLVRLGIFSELFHQVVVVFVALALYRLFKPINEYQAKLLLIFGALVSLPILFANVLNEIAALMLVSGAPFLNVFAQPQLDALAYLFIRLHGQGIQLTAIFWGLWLFPFAMLVIRSGFIPRLFGVLLMIAGTAYLMSSFTSLIVPRYEHFIDAIEMPMKMCELPIVFWLVIWGARRDPRQDTARFAGEDGGEPD